MGVCGYRAKQHHSRGARHIDLVLGTIWAGENERLPYGFDAGIGHQQQEPVQGHQQRRWALTRPHIGHESADQWHETAAPFLSHGCSRAVLESRIGRVFVDGLPPRSD